MGFVIGCWMSKKDVEQRDIKGFFGKVFWSGSVYFLSLPVMMLIVSLFSNLHQQFVMHVGMHALSIGSTAVMLRQFGGKGEYYRASVRSASILPNKWE